MRLCFRLRIYERLAPHPNPLPTYAGRGSVLKTATSHFVFDLAPGVLNCHSPFAALQNT